MFLPPPPSEAGTAPDRPARRPLWRQVWGLAPGWAWAVVVAVQVPVAAPFWLYKSPAPYHGSYGDVYRGWPFTYGLDQGDVIGDEWGPFTAYFDPVSLVIDTIAAVACGLPATGVVIWVGNRVRRRVGVPAAKPGRVSSRGGS